VAAVVGEGLARRGGPQAGDDGELLLQARELGRRERDAVRRVLGLVPAGAEAELDPAARHGVDLRDLDGERAGQPEGGRRHQRAEPDAAGLAGQPGQRDPGVGGTRQALRVAHLQVVVGAEEGVEAQLLGGLGDGELGVVAGALLGFGEDTQITEIHAPHCAPPPHRTRQVVT
jgi:hypothetical protein